MRAWINTMIHTHLDELTVALRRIGCYFDIVDVPERVDQDAPRPSLPSDPSIDEMLGETTVVARPRPSRTTPAERRVYTSTAPGAPSGPYFQFDAKGRFLNFNP